MHPVLAIEKASTVRAGIQAEAPRVPDEPTKHYRIHSTGLLKIFKTGLRGSFSGLPFYKGRVSLQCAAEEPRTVAFNP